MENDGKMSVERSLEIISGAIELGRRDVERNAGTPMIMWGVLMSVTGCLVWLLWKLTGNSHWNMLWFAACAVGWIAYGLVQRKDHKERKPLTYVWKIIRLVWTVFGLLALAVAVVGSLSLDGSVYGASLPIVAVMILFAYACFISNCLCAEKQCLRNLYRSEHHFRKLCVDVSRSQ